MRRPAKEPYAGRLKTRTAAVAHAYDGRLETSKKQQKLQRYTEKM